VPQTLASLLQLNSSGLRHLGISYQGWLLADFDNAAAAAWPLLIFESGPTPICFDRFKLHL
jgi:hypothetical protein